MFRQRQALGLATRRRRRFLERFKLRLYRDDVFFERFLEQLALGRIELFGTAAIQGTVHRRHLRFQHLDARGSVSTDSGHLGNLRIAMGDNGKRFAQSRLQVVVGRCINTHASIVKLYQRADQGFCAQPMPVHPGA